MKLNLRDEPKEWRKSALSTVVGLALFSSLLRWQRVIDNQAWLAIVSILVLAAFAAIWRPRWFRGYHMFSMRVGLAISRFLGRVLLVTFFLFVLTPTAWVFRFTRKDSLQLKATKTSTYWQPAKNGSPLDRLF